jgi:cytochrome c
MIDTKSAGPAYKDVAKKYKGQSNAVDLLSAKVIKGGAGVWGTTEMAAHPQIGVEDAKKMVEYVLSLANDKVDKKLPVAGSVKPGKETDGAYVLTATYFDKAQDKVPSQSTSDAVVLRSGTMSVNSADELQIARKLNYQGNWALENVRNGATAMYKGIDLTGVKKATLMTYSVDMTSNPGGEIEVHIDKPDGKLLGKVTSGKQGLSMLPTALAPETGKHDLYIVFKNAGAGDKSLFYFSGIKLENK